MKPICAFLSFLFIFFGCVEDKGDLVEPYLTIKLDSDVFNVPIEGGTEVVKVQTNLSKWIVISKQEGGYDWCDISKTVSSSDIHLLTLIISRNTGVEKREAGFILRGEGIDDVELRVVQLGSQSAILVNVESKKVSKESQIFTIQVTANVGYKLRNESDWLTLDEKQNPETKALVQTNYMYSVTDNVALSSRKDTIVIESVGLISNPIIVKIPIEQEAAGIDDVIPEDIKIKVESVTMIQGTIYGSQGPQNTIDGNLSTAYNSNKSDQKPIVFEYKLQEMVDRVHYIILHQAPTSNSTNQLTKGKVEFKSSTSDWVECGVFDESLIVPTIRVELSGVVNPTHFRLTMQRTLPPAPGNVNLAEFECYKKPVGSDFDLISDAKYFEDNVYSQLKSTTTQDDLSKITHPMLRVVAQELLNGTYSTEFRARVYHSCKNPNIVGKELKIGKRSICDNPTGLFFQKNKKYIVFVGNEIGSSTINFYIRDFRENGGDQTFALKKGLNILDPRIDGTGYIQYWTDDNIEKPAVKIHVCSGDEIGFWDVRAGHNNSDWIRILNIASTCAQRLNITNAMLDVSGERVQLVNTIQAFKSCCPNDIVEIMKMHDELMRIEYMMMGLYKNNAVPRNRMLGIRKWDGSPVWTGTAACFPNAEETMLNRNSFIESIWVYGHEFGHGNQISGMKGGGWAEVTNNVYAQHAKYLMGSGSCRIEHTDFKRQGYSDKVIGDRFNAYINDAVVKGKSYLTHEGGVVNDPINGEYYESDPFVSLVPLWQLSLFFMLTNDAPWTHSDFWPDINWACICDKNSDYTFGENYVNFMRRAMDASGMDLSVFFKKMGLLREINMRVGDYGGPKQIIITKAMVDEIEAYASTKASAPTSVIYYISANSLNAFGKRLSVQGNYNQGIASSGFTKTVSHSVWKNVVAFETYAGNVLIEACIVGTGSTDNTSTYVRYPLGSTRIEAVSWDGHRTLVCGSR